MTGWGPRRSEDPARVAIRAIQYRVARFQRGVEMPLGNLAA